MTPSSKNTSILGLRTTIYHVADLKAAKEWYSKAFQTEAYFDESFYVGFNIGGYELGLLPEETPVSQIKTVNVVSYWGVEDIESAFQHFIDTGSIAHEAPHSVGDPLKVATVKDPWQNIIGLIYNPVFQLPTT